jgi:hypothetical protein
MNKPRQITPVWLTQKKIAALKRLAKQRRSSISTLAELLIQRAFDQEEN